MGKIKNSVLSAYHFISPPKWPLWDKQLAHSQEFSDYISLSELLELQQIGPLSLDWLQDQKLEDLITSTSRRRRSLTRYKDLVPILKSISVLSILVTTSAVVLNTPQDSFLSEKFLLAGLTTFTISGVPIAILSAKNIKLRQKNLQVPLSELTLPSFKNQVELIQTFLKKIRNIEPTPFFCEADTKIKSISKSFWKADCWGIGMFLDMEKRACVSLDGIPPSGDVMFLKSEIASILQTKESSEQVDEPNSNTQIEPSTIVSPNIYEQYGLPRNTRWCPHLRAVHSRMAFINALVKEAEARTRDKRLDNAFLTPIAGFRVIQKNSVNWQSLQKGKLDNNVKLEIEKKIRKALHPEDPEAERAHALLSKFLKPDNRRFDKHISTWGIIPEKDVLKQVDLYFEKNPQMPKKTIKPT